MRWEIGHEGCRGVARACGLALVVASSEDGHKIECGVLKTLAKVDGVAVPAKVSIRMACKAAPGDECYKPDTIEHSLSEG